MLNKLMGLGLLMGATLLAAGCAVEAPSSRTTPSLLDARGAGAAIIQQEWWILFGVSAAIFLLVAALLLAAVWQRRAGRSGPVEMRDAAPDAHAGGGARWIWIGGIAMPFVVLLGVFALNVRDLQALGAPPSAPVAAVRINGHRWWWEVEYPDQGFKTANQLYIPVGQAVQIDLTSADVIHSFWVPQLQFKRDLIPGQTNTV